MSKYSPKQVKPSQGRMFEIIRNPIITEKATNQANDNQVSFYVPLDSNKFEIRKAVETVYSTKVTAVNTILVKGKTKMFRGKPGKRNDFKKAIVTLADGETIDVMTGA